jgi:hypothetical protein
MTHEIDVKRRDDQSPAHVPGVSVTRRVLMNKLVALPIAASGIVPMLPGRAAAGTARSPEAALHAYAAWLHMERRILCGEIWPHMGAEAERYTWMDNAGAHWHFNGRGNLGWNEGPQPSSRAAAVLDLVGVDWRQPQEDIGLNHADNGHRPELPTGWPKQVDPVIDLARETIAAWDAFEACLPALGKAEDLMAAWEMRNPKPERPADQSKNGTVEYEAWFKKLLEANSEKKKAALRAIDPNREFKATIAKYEEARAKWKQRKEVAERQSGLQHAEAEEKRMSELYQVAAKKLRETQPVSLRGIIAKARACYYSGCDQIHYWQLMVDICEMFDGVDDDKLPDLIV